MKKVEIKRHRAGDCLASRVRNTALFLLLSAKKIQTIVTLPLSPPNHQPSLHSSLLHAARISPKGVVSRFA